MKETMVNLPNEVTKYLTTPIGARLSTVVQIFPLPWRLFEKDDDYEEQVPSKK